LLGPVSIPVLDDELGRASLGAELDCLVERVADNAVEQHGAMLRPALGLY
jgi:hypothetical protein